MAAFARSTRFARWGWLHRRRTIEHADCAHGDPCASAAYVTRTCRSDTGHRSTFKGGTSLSKGWKLIVRFSEDIDVVIARDFLGFGGDKAPEGADSKKQREARLEELREACRAYVQDVLHSELRAQLESRLPKSIEWRLENDPNDPDQQSLLFTYPSVFTRGA
jgi:hypothetical protein